MLALWRPGRKTVMTKKVLKHLKVLASKSKVEGLFNWRKVASLLREAGVPMQSGTVPVERLWANYTDFFPEAATGLTREWWDLLNDLGYLRFNYRHFNHSDLPSFTRGDTLLAERIDDLVTLTRALRQAQMGDESPSWCELQSSLRPPCHALD